MISNIFYELPQKSWWQGRVDGVNKDQYRWHQNVEIMELNALKNRPGQIPILFLGFACDEGVIRNQGRKGAVNGPVALRKACSNLPVHFDDHFHLLDVGNIACIDGKLEEAQQHLAKAVCMILDSGGLPILLGGGHEIVYGHFLGIREKFPDKKIGIINFDAHFDLRPPGPSGGNSGTGFFQIARQCENEQQEFLYMALGVQRSANTKALFTAAEHLGVPYLLADDMNLSNITSLENNLQGFLDRADIIYLSIDLDVFATCMAPGVSAPTATGLIYDRVFRHLLEVCFRSQKVISMDIAELNPEFDIDSRTARLGAQLIFDALGEYTSGKVNL